MSNQQRRESIKIIKEAYMRYVPNSIIFKMNPVDSREWIKEGNWAEERAEIAIDKLSLSDVDPSLPQPIKILVFKLTLIATDIDRRMLHNKELFVATFAEKIDNYLIKVKLADYAYWQNEVNPVDVVESVSDLIPVSWLMMIEETFDISDIEKHTKVLMDKLVLQKEQRQPIRQFKDPQGHEDRCRKLKVGIYDYSEQHILEKYNLIWGGLE